METQLRVDHQFVDATQLPNGQSGIIVRALLKISGTAPRIATRPPIGLSFVIDRSGSMSGERIEAARMAAARAIERMHRRLSAHCGRPPHTPMTGGAGWKVSPYLDVPHELVDTLIFHGLLVLQSLLQDLSAEWRAGHHETPEANRILLLPVPGSQHTFGLLMVAELFRLEGWQVWADPVATVREVVDLTRHRWFDVVGFSIGTLAQTNAARSAILLVRKQSSNRRVRILVGGPAIQADPALGKWLYADMVANDGCTAVQQAEQLVREARQTLAEPT